MERCCFLGLVVDGTTRSGAKARMGSSMFKREVVESEELELVYGESKGPRDAFGCEELRWCIRLGGEGHVQGGKGGGSFCI